MAGVKPFYDRFRRSYLAKMLALFLVIAVAVAGSGVLMEGTIAAELNEDVREEVEVVGGLQAEELDLWLESRRENTRMLSAFGVMTSDDTAEVDAFLDHERENLPEEVHTLSVVDVESRTVVASSDPGVEGGPVQRVGIGTQESLEFETDAVHQTEPYVLDGVAYVSFISPVPGDDGRAVVLTADLDVVAEHVFQSPFEGGFTQVVGPGDRVVLDQRGGSTLQRYAVTDSEALTAGRAGEHGVLEQGAADGLLGEEHLVQHAPVNGGEWVLLYHVPSSEAFAVADVVQRDIFLLVGLFLAGLGMVGVVLHRYTVEPVTRLAAHVSTLEQGDLDATADSGLRDEIGRLFDGVDALRRTIKERIETAEAATAEARAASREAEAAKQEAQALGDHLERKASAFGTTMAACADGDLTGRLDPDSSSEAMTEVARSFNAMLDEIEGTVVRVQAFSEDVAAMSQQVTVSVEEIRDASEEVSESVVHIAEGSADQNDQLLEMTDAMNDLSAAVEEISSSTDELSALTTSAAADGERGTAAATAASEGMARIEAETEETVASIDALADQLQRIDDIVTTITDIAEQTNILALNANIEAARAGEAGQGFAVVAGEVKSLAEETHSSVAEIGRIIADVSEQRRTVVEGMESMRAQVDEGSEAVDEAIGALADIAAKVEDTDVGVGEINRATDDQATSAQHVLETADRVSDVSDETSAKAANVSAAAQQQAASVAEVSDGVRHLADRTDDLGALLDSFEVREASADVTAGGAGAPSAVTDGGAGPDRAD